MDTPTEKSRKVSAKGDERGRRLYEPLTGGQIARGLFGGGVRALARRSKDVNQSRRLLSLAAVRDGMNRGLGR